MMRSLYSGISGLSVHQTKMDVIGNNIANVNTTAFKAGRVTFTDVFSQKLAGASAGDENLGGRNPSQIGLGANVGSIDLLIKEGAAQRTDRDLDIKIEGDGFFVVKDASGFKFTRDGSFKIDVNGYLTTSGGNYVCGWRADKNGVINPAPVERLSMITTDTFSVPAVKTTNIDFSKNLSIADGDPSKSGITQLSTMYDSLGNEYTIKNQFYYFKNADEVTKYNNTHDVPIQIEYKSGTANAKMPADADKIAGKDYTTIAAGQSFPMWVAMGISSVTDAQGKEVNASDEFAKKAITGADATKKYTFASATNILSGYPKVFKFKADGTFDQANSDGKFDYNFGAADVEFPIDGITATLGTGNELKVSMKELTQYNSATTAASTYDGNKPGTMSSYSIGDDGVISAKYTNGATKILGQIALATFANSAGLEKTGNNLYQSTLNSGNFDGVGVTPTSVGSLNSGALEMSNVNLSTEFTEMITTQRGFQANSRIITTSDSLLEELVNLKR